MAIRRRKKGADSRGREQAFEDNVLAKVCTMAEGSFDEQKQNEAKSSGKVYKTSFEEITLQNNLIEAWLSNLRVGSLQGPGSKLEEQSNQMRNE